MRAEARILFHLRKQWGALTELTSPREGGREQIGECLSCGINAKLGESGGGLIREARQEGDEGGVDGAGGEAQNCVEAGGRGPILAPPDRRGRGRVARGD